MIDANFERRIFTIENHLPRLAELLATRANANINQSYHDLSSSSNRFLFKIETKVNIPTFGEEVDAEMMNN